MNGFDVQAIGWVITRDACAEIARGLLGSPRRMAPEELQSLGDHWLIVRARLGEDARVPIGHSLQPLATVMPPRAEGDVREFVQHMLTCCPQRYSEPVLRSRCFNTVAQALFGFVGGAIAVSFATPEHVFFGDVAIVLLVMACCLTISTIQLWRTYRVVRRFNQSPARAGPRFCGPREHGHPQAIAAASARYKANRKPATVGSTTIEPPS